MKLILQGPKRLIRQASAQAHCAAPSPDGTLLAIAFRDYERNIRNTVLLWDIARQAELRILSGNTGAVGAVAFSPDGKTVTVNGYFRKDGTYVAPQTRSAPGTAAKPSRGGRGK